MATTIPDKMYVTIQYRKDAAEGLLGFASPYTSDAAFQKRKDTQDRWAYGYGTDFIIGEDDGVVSGPSATNPDVFAFFATNCNPRIVKNEPIAGFEISKTVRRYGWSGSGNVVWRIADPRGYELEISSENFARIIDCTTLVNGVIQDKCVWGREGGKNVLLPVSSEPYKEANKHTTLINNKISLKDITVGDHVTLIDKSQKSGSRDGIYLGRMFVVCSEDVPVNKDSYQCAEQILASKTVDKHVFRDPASKEIYAVNKPSIGALVNSGVEKTSLTDNIAEVNSLLSDGELIDNFPSSAVLVVQKAAEITKVSVVLEDAAITMNSNKFLEVGQGYYSRSELLVVTKDGDNHYITTNSRDKNVSVHSADGSVPTLFGIESTSFTDTHIKVKYKQNTTSSASGWWGTRTQTHAVASDILTKFDIADYKAKSIWLVAGDFKARVFTTSGGFSRFVRDFS